MRDGVSTAEPHDFVSSYGSLCQSSPNSFLRMNLMRENPFERKPSDRSPMSMSPSVMSAPVIRLLLSKTPTAVAFHTLPFTASPSSAISPPGTTILFSSQALASPSVSWATAFASTLFVSRVFVIEIHSAPTQAASSATIATRSYPNVSNLPRRSATSIFVPTPSSFWTRRKSPMSSAPVNPPSS